MNTKNSLTLSSLACCLALAADSSLGQTQSPPPTIPAVSGEYSIIERGPDWRVWQEAVLTTNESGIVTTNLHSYTKICTGICYLQNGQYVDSVEQIDIVGQGAQAVQSSYRVQFAPDASTAGGAVQMTSPAGEQFNSRVYGLSLRDISN